MKKLIFILAIFCFIITHAQDEKILPIEEVVEEIESDYVPFSIIEEVPVHPNCKNLITNQEKTRCFNTSINKHVARKFNTNLANCIEEELVYNEKTKEEELKCIGLKSGKKRIYASFKINKDGIIEDIYIRAPHEKLKQEAIRVVKLLPKMEPGKQRGKPIAVAYTLPISFIVE